MPCVIARSLSKWVGLFTTAGVGPDWLTSNAQLHIHGRLLGRMPLIETYHHAHIAPRTWQWLSDAACCSELSVCKPPTAKMVMALPLVTGLSRGFSGAWLCPLPGVACLCFPDAMSCREAAAGCWPCHVTAAEPSSCC